jgi:hypothetical protein
VQTQLISAAVATVATVIFNYPKKISAASENICDAKKPAALAAVAAPDKNRQRHLNWWQVIFSIRLVNSRNRQTW